MGNDYLLAGPERAPKLSLSFYVHVHVDYMVVHVCTCTLQRIYFGALVIVYDTTVAVYKDCAKFKAGLLGAFN